MAIKWDDFAEAQLILLSQAGDDLAFGELVRRRQGGMRLMLRRVTGNAALADDLAQEVFIKAWRVLGTLRTPDAFGGWLRRIAVRSWLDHKRSSGPDHENSEETDVAAPVGDPASGLDLERALAGLGEKERLCLVLAYGEGMSHSEVADVTDLPLGTVKSHVGRAAAKVRRVLGA